MGPPPEPHKGPGRNLEEKTDIPGKLSCHTSSQDTTWGLACSVRAAQGGPHHMRLQTGSDPPSPQPWASSLSRSPPSWDLVLRQPLLQGTSHPGPRTGVLSKTAQGPKPFCPQPYAVHSSEEGSRDCCA
jgi:hypothetical protein